jgi:hypothetical protein
MAGIQGSLWLVVGVVFSVVIGFPYLGDGEKVNPFASAVLIITAAFFSGILAAVAGIIATRKDYLSGKILLTEADKTAAAKMPAPVKPYWLSPLMTIMIQSIVVAGHVIGVCYFSLSHGLTRFTLAAFCGGIMFIHAAITAWRIPRRELLKSVAHPAEAATPFVPYMWKEHILGSAVINYGINALIGYVMYRQGPKHPDPVTKFELLIADVLIMSIMVSILTALNSEMQAANDVKLKEAIPPDRKSDYHPGFAVRIPAYIVIGAIAAAAWIGLTFLLGIKSFSVLEVMTIKGLIAAIVAGVAAGLGARWSASKNA